MATESGAENKKPKGNAFKRFFVAIGVWLKAAALELRKTTWPKFNEVMSKLGIVFVVILFFFFALVIMDILLTMGFNALTTSHIPDARPWWQFWPSV